MDVSDKFVPGRRTSAAPNTDAYIDAPERGDVEEFFDVPYGDSAIRQRRMDIFRPAGPDEVLPVIIDIHGTGTNQGVKDVNRNFCRALGWEGFLVFNLEYRADSKTTAYQQFDDIIAAVNTIEGLLAEYGGDPTRTCMVGDGIGALLAVYTTAMQKSPELAEAATVVPFSLPIKALGLISPLLYTCRRGEVGRLKPKKFWGQAYLYTDIAEYTDPENPEIVGSLPPTYIVTSAEDMFRQHGLDFAQALRSAGIERVLDNFPENPLLTYDFPVMQTKLPESRLAIEHMADLFYS